MVQRRSVRQARLMLTFGEHIRRWRKINGMSASDLASRSFITRETLRNIEKGTGSTRLDSVFAVLTTLGILDAIVTAADPFESDAARTRIDAILGSGGSV